MEKKNEVPMIYLKDLLFTALYQWKRILLTALVFAVLLGGINLTSSLISLNNQERLAQIERENKIRRDRYEAESTAMEMQVSHLLTSIQNQQVYLDNSPLMKMDPYNHFEGTMVVYVDTDYKINTNSIYQDPDPTHAIITAYQNLLLSDECMNDLGKILEADPLYMPELIQFDNNTGNSQNNSVLTTSSNLLTIHVKAADKELANDMIVALQTHINNNYASVKEKIGPHNVKILKKTVTPKVDPVLAQTQQTANAHQDQLMKDLNTIQEKQNKLTLPVIQNTSIAAVIKRAIGSALIGAALGIFLAVAVIWISHISSDKVYSRRALTNRTGLKLLGLLNAGHDDTVSHKLHHLEGRCNTDPEADAAVLAANIAIRCQDAKVLVLTGAVSCEARQVLVDALAKCAPQLTLINAQDIAQSAEALAQLAACDAVVLVEQCHISRYEIINHRISLIQDHNKQLLGCVLYGG